jgi:CRP-like cAMP-binding protein
MTEGIVKVVVRKSQQSDEIVNTFQLKKGAFFGEVALLTQTKRTSDVVAIDFCVLESFTRESFQQLQIVFPDIYDRLQIGFSHYKVKAIEILVKNLQKNELFSQFEKMDLDDMVRDYMELKFVDANKLVLKPKR